MTNAVTAIATITARATARAILILQTVYVAAWKPSSRPWPYSSGHLCIHIARVRRPLSLAKYLMVATSSTLVPRWRRTASNPSSTSAGTRTGSCLLTLRSSSEPSPSPRQLGLGLLGCGYALLGDPVRSLGGRSLVCVRQQVSSPQQFG